MNKEEINNDLKKLIKRLQDSEEGYRKISKASSKPKIVRLVDLYANVRLKMQRVLDAYIKDLGRKPRVSSSFLGALHKSWVNLKGYGWEKDLISIANEIEQGSNVLVEEYQVIFEKVDKESPIYQVLKKHKEQISLELNELCMHRNEAAAIIA